MGKLQNVLRRVGVTLLISSFLLSLFVGPAPKAVALGPIWQPQPNWGIERISHDVDGGVGNAANGGVDAWSPVISGDGNYVAYVSRATNMVPGGDTNPSGSDVILRDRTTGQNEYASVASSGQQINGDNFPQALSDDGRHVLFSNGQALYMRDRQAGTTELLHDINGTIITGFYASMSADQRYVAFTTDNPSLVPGGMSTEITDVVVLDRNTGEIELASEQADGSRFSGHISGGNDSTPAMSADGRYVVFNVDGDSQVAGDTNGLSDVYVRDMVANTTTWLSSNMGTAARGGCHQATISADGNFAAYRCDVSFDSVNYQQLVFRTNVASAQTVLASKDENGDPVSHADFASLSPDGRYVGFRWLGFPPNVNQNDQVTVRDMQTNHTALLTQTPGGSGVADFYGYHSVFSRDGNWVAFDSNATNLTNESLPRAGKVFVRPLPFNTPILPDDEVPPTITYTLNPDPNTEGWNKTNVTVTFDCEDNVEVATCSDPITVSTEGADQVVTGTATDTAGNTTSVDVTLNVDKTDPTITHSVTPAPNAAGWNNANVTVTFTCNDTLSGVVDCPDPITVSSDTSGQVVSGTTTDKAGNTASTNATVKLDKTSPVVSNLTLSPTFILFVGNMTISADASDVLSGVEKGEYFIDTDPGTGNGTAMTYNSTTGKITGTKQFTLGSLSVGWHTMSVRAKDKAGNWGAPISRQFFYL